MAKQSAPPDTPVAMPQPAVSHPRSASTTRHLALTIDHVWLAATLTFAFIVGTLLQADQTDYWWTVKLGEGLWATGQLPAADPLAFTSTRQPYVEQQWLAQLVLAAVHDLGGVELALLFRGALLVLAVGLLYRACRATGAAAGAAATACTIALLSIVGGAAIRPQLLAIPLFVLFLLGTTVWILRPWTLVALPLAMVAWANLHGSFPLGIALVGAALAGRALTVAAASSTWARAGGAILDDQTVRRLGLLLALCLVAPLANPYGLGILPWLVDYLTFNTGGTGLSTLSLEWLPTSIATAHGTLFFLSVFLLVAVLLRVGPPSPADCLRLFGFAVLALQAVRSTLWWALVMAPVLAWGLTRLVAGVAWQSANSRGSSGELVPPAPGRAIQEAPRADDRRGVPALNALLVAGFALVALLSLPWLRPAGVLYPPERWPVQDPALPVAAADYLAILPATRLYNAMDWGGYLAWRLAPRQRIFIDGRFQLYPPELYRDYFRIAAAEPGWDQRLSAYGVDALVLSRGAQGPLLRALADDGRWRPVYCDSVAAVYLPRDRSGAPEVPCAAPEQ